MAAFDWNGDGKNNIYDDMLEWHNIRQSLKDSSEYGYSDGQQKEVCQAREQAISIFQD